MAGKNQSRQFTVVRKLIECAIFLTFINIYLFSIRRNAVLNERGMVVSYIYTSTSTSHELEPQAAELLDRFVGFGEMSQHVAPDATVTVQNQPHFIVDRCCDGGTLWLESAGWLNPTKTGDFWHIKKRIAQTVTSKPNESQIPLAQFHQELSKAFKSTAPGVFVSPEEILENIEKVKSMFSRAEYGSLWTQKTTDAFNLQKTHITNCLVLPDGIPPIIFDRDGKISLTRGTNRNENFHR